MKRNTDPSVDRKERRRIVAKKYGKCAYCRPHDGENAKRPERSDRGKNHRRTA